MFAKLLSADIQLHYTADVTLVMYTCRGAGGLFLPSSDVARLCFSFVFSLRIRKQDFFFTEKVMFQNVKQLWSKETKAMTPGYQNKRQHILLMSFVTFIQCWLPSEQMLHSREHAAKLEGGVKLLLIHLPAETLAGFQLINSNVTFK